MPDWKSENLRLTAFLHAPLAALDEHGWESLTGATPESKHYRPQERILAVTGPVFDGQCNFSLTGTAERIDWLLTGRDDPTAGEDRPFPFAGAFNERTKQFRELMARWLASAQPLKRLAFGAVVVTPVNDISEGLKVLQPLLPSIKLAPTSLDFAYSINRPCISRVVRPNLRVNRLSKWNVMSLQRLRLIATLAPGVTAMQQAMIGESLNVARIEIDINTAADYQNELPRNKLSKLLSELIDLGIEIIEKGDQP